MKFSSCYNKGNMKKTSFIVEVIVCCIFTNPCSVPDMATSGTLFVIGLKLGSLSSLLL